MMYPSCGRLLESLVSDEHSNTEPMKLLISILVLFLTPCNRSKALQTSAITDYSKVQITYSETPCFGKCPVYTLVLDGASMVATYTGVENTDKIGAYTKAISAAEFSRFLEALDKANYKKLDNEYMGLIADFPIRELTINIDGKLKKIRNRSGAPAELEELELIFKNFADAEGWAKK